MSLSDLPEAARRLDATAGLLRILDDFAANSIEVMPWKGPVLSQLLYGDVARRSFTDLDLLIQRTDFARAAARLQSLGYRPEKELTRSQLRAQLRHLHDFTFLHDDLIMVELHWDFAQHHFAYQIDVAGVRDRARRVAFCGRTVLQPAAEDLVVLLATHAARHDWRMLDLLQDWTAAARQVADWDGAWLRARVWRVQRILAVTARLALALGLDPPRPVLDLAEPDPVAGDIAERCCSALATGARLSRGTLLRAREHQADRWRQRVRLALTPTINDWRVLRLPDSLYFLYYPIRQARLAVAAARRLA